MADQNYSNHAKMVPMYHYFTLLGTLLTVIGACVNLYDAWGTDGQYDASLIAVLAVLLLVAAFYARVFALAVQDRVIRAEENMRHYVRHGSMMDSRLTMDQIIGLRFAPDEEWDDLARKAIANNMNRKEIKMAVKNWKADHHRA